MNLAHRLGIYVFSNIFFFNLLHINQYELLREPSLASHHTTKPDVPSPGIEPWDSAVVHWNFIPSASPIRPIFLLFLINLKSTRVWAVEHFLFCGFARCLCCQALRQCKLGRVRTASVLWMKLAAFVTIGSWKLQVSTNERSSRKTYLIRQLPLSLLSNYF